MEHVLKFKVKLLPDEQPSQEVISKYRKQISDVVVLLEKNKPTYECLKEVIDGDSITFGYIVDIA